MWVLLWLQLVSGTFDHYHVGSYSSEEACKEAQKEAKVLVTNQNSKVVVIITRDKRVAIKHARSKK